MGIRSDSHIQPLMRLTWAIEGATIIQIQGIRGEARMKPSCRKKASYRLALLTSFLLSIAMALQPAIAQAADGDTTTTVAMLRADTSAQAEPSSNVPVVLRGTRPVTPAAARRRS